MRKRKQQVTEGNRTVSRSSKRCSSSGGQQYFDMIPIDLIIKIFSKLLSCKSMGKCRCVSKQWSSILRSPNYNQLFPFISPDPPRLLFTFLVEEKLFYFSSPQPQNLAKNSSLLANHHHTISDTYVTQICRPIRGLVCHQLSVENYTIVVIFNPITGQSVSSPKLITAEFDARCYFGYDPIYNQFKVLCLTLVLRGAAKEVYVQHKVLTLETGNGNENVLWRKVPCCIPYYYLSNDRLFNDDGICINGVLYYRANVNMRGTIVCFNVRSERFDFIREKTNSTLINYKGKLGAISNFGNRYLELWILEDVEEQEWSKHIYEIPNQWWEFMNLRSSYYVGATRGGEIVFYPRFGVEDHFYIFYYSLDRKDLVRVRVKFPGFEVFKCRISFTFPNYVEDVKLM